MVGSIKTYTPKYSFIIPEFDIATWHDYMESNFRAIDALLYNLYGINNFKGEWTKLTEYKVGDVVFVGEDKDITGKSSEYEGRLVKVIKDHVTDNSDGFHYFYELNTDCYELYFDANNAAYFAQKSKESADASEVSYQNSKNLENIYINFRDLTEEYKNLAQDAATNASNSEQSALTAASTAINTVQAATDLLNTTQQYTEAAIETITNTRDEAVETVTTIANEAKTTAENAITSVENTKTEAENEIAETVEQGRVTIQTYVDNAEEEVREIARVEAQEAIADAKQDVQDYADTTIKPSLQIYVDNTENNAQIATEKANIATIKANECLESANASANSAISANNSAEQAEEALKSITGVYRVKGSVATYNNLPSVGQKVGDVYNVLDSGANYVWTDNGWDKLSETVDLSNYALKTELPTLARANVPGLVAGGNWLTVNQTTGKMECGELTKAQYDSALGYTFISKTTLENRLVSKQDKLVSGTSIKTLNNESLLGSGNIDINSAQWGNISGDISNQSDLQTALQQAGTPDDATITKTSENKLQAIGIIDSNGNAMKTWRGTLAEYNALATKDDNTLYKITDDTDTGTDLLQMIYPVGSLYLTTNATCPLANLFGTWTLVSQDRVLQGAGNRGGVGTTLDESLPNIKGHFGADDSPWSSTTNGAFYKGSSWNYDANSGTGNGGYIEFDASRSSSTYKDDAPVQQDAYLINVFRRIN